MRATTFTSALGFTLAASPQALGRSLLSQHQSNSERSGIPEGKRQAHRLAYLDITNGVPTDPLLGNETTAALEQRRNVDYCIADASQTGVCIGVASLLASIGFGVAGLLKSNSDGNDCEPHQGSIDGITWEVWAEGNNCDTTAQRNTIAGAVENYLRDSDKELCGVHCMKLTHGGTWAGYVTLAAPGEDLDDFYCGKFNSWGNCGSGGEDDA